MSGGWVSNHSQSGTWSATRTERPSSTQVICNYDVATGTDTCGANVADAGAPPTITPTGQVRFSSNFGGTFRGDSCTLAQTPDSPGVASCTVQFLPPPTQPVIQPGGVSATYAGDAEHSGSGGATQLLGTIPTMGADNFPTGGCGSTGSSAARDTASAHLASTDGKGCGLAVATVGTGTLVASPVLPAAAPAATGVLVTGLEALGISVGGPVAWAIAGITTVIVGGAIASKSDPPDQSYSALALPPAGGKLAQRPGGCAAGPKGSSCRSLRRRLNAYLTAQLQTVPATLAEAIATNRQLNAIDAKDSAAIALQIAAEKAYYGQLSAADNTLTSSARALAGALRRTGHDTMLSASSIVSRTRKLLPRLSSVMVKLLAGLHESRKEVSQQLNSIPGRLSASVRSMLHGRTRISLSQLLGAGLNVAGFSRIYRSMTVENLRALVYGLARSKTISAGHASELVSDLSCSSGRPNIARFSSDARKLITAKYAALLRFAAVPVARAKSCT